MHGLPGGCSAPNPGATASLGAIAIKQYDRVGGASRLKIRLAHPMNTGFASEDDGTPIPAYYIEALEIFDDDGLVATMETWAAMSADPVITLDLPERRQNIRVYARDSKGLLFEGALLPPSM